MQDVSPGRVVGLTIASLAGLALSAPELARTPARWASSDPNESLTVVVYAGLAAVSLWLLVATVLVVASQSCPGLRRFAPGWAAALLATGTLFSVGSLLTGGSAHAAAPDMDGLPLPDRPTMIASPVADLPATTDETVVVQPGDCLWDLARARLGVGATDAQVATATTRWYEANAATIGPDPNLLHPGLHLVVPAAGDAVTP